MGESDGTEIKKFSDYVTDLWSFLQQKQLLIIYIFGYIVSMVAANITFKMEANAFINYPMFTTWLNIVLMTPLFAVPTVYGTNLYFIFSPPRIDNRKHFQRSQSSSILEIYPCGPF